MRPANEESEAKFLVADLPRLEQRLLASGARLIQSRILEQNYRFDTVDGELTRSGRVLRLRRDNEVRLTYKGPGRRESGVLSRRELEIGVTSLELARDLLLALGYDVVFFYEKYRTIYSFNSVEFMLDELPYGNFVEIEGETAAIGPAALALGLRWEASIPSSYHDLFVDLRAKMSLPFRDLTFDSFADHTVTPEDLGAQSADLPGDSESA